MMIVTHFEWYASRDRKNCCMFTETTLELKNKKRKMWHTHTLRKKKWWWMTEHIWLWCLAIYNKKWRIVMKFSFSHHKVVSFNLKIVSGHPYTCFLIKFCWKTHLSPFKSLSFTCRRTQTCVRPWNTFCLTQGTRQLNKYLLELLILFLFL